MTTAEDENLTTIADIAAQVVAAILDRLEVNTPRDESAVQRPRSVDNSNLRGIAAVQPGIQPLE